MNVITKQDWVVFEEAFEDDNPDERLTKADFDERFRVIPDDDGSSYIVTSNEGRSMVGVKTHSRAMKIYGHD